MDFLFWASQNLHLTNLDLRGIELAEWGCLEDPRLRDSLISAHERARQSRDEQVADDKERRERTWARCDEEPMPPSAKDQQDAKRRQESRQQRGEAAAREEEKIMKTPPLVIDLRDNDLVNHQGTAGPRWPKGMYEYTEKVNLRYGYAQPWITTELVRPGPTELFPFHSIGLYDQLEAYALEVPRALIDTFMSTYDPIRPLTWINEIMEHAGDLGDLYLDAYSHTHPWTSGSTDSQWRQGQDDTPWPMDYGRYRACLDDLKRLATNSSLDSIRAAITEQKITAAEAALEAFSITNQEAFRAAERWAKADQLRLANDHKRRRNSFDRLKRNTIRAQELRRIQGEQEAEAALQQQLQQQQQLHQQAAETIKGAVAGDEHVSQHESHGPTATHGLNTADHTMYVRHNAAVPLPVVSHPLHPHPSLPLPPPPIFSHFAPPPPHPAVPLLHFEAWTAAVVQLPPGAVVLPGWYFNYHRGERELWQTSRDFPGAMEVRTESQDANMRTMAALATARERVQDAGDWIVDKAQRAGEWVAGFFGCMR